MGYGKRERAAARLDLAKLTAHDSPDIKSSEVIFWLRRKSLKDMGVVVGENDLSADELTDLVSINSMWAEISSRSSKRGK